MNDPKKNPKDIGQKNPAPKPAAPQPQKAPKPMEKGPAAPAKPQPPRPKH